VFEARGPSRAKVIVAFAIVYVVWGSTYIFVRFAIDTLPPLLMAGFRYVVAGALLWAWSRARGAAPATRAQWRSAAIIGGLLFLLGNGAIALAIQRIPSGIAALIVALVPVWMVLLAWLWAGGPRPRGTVVAGLVLGLIGLVLLVGPGELAGSNGIDLIATGMLVIGTLGWAAGSIYARDADLPSAPSMATALEMVAGGALLLVAGVLASEVSALRIDQITLRSALALAYLIVFGSIIAFSAYMWLLNVTTPARLSTYAYVNPIVALLLGWAFAGESLTMRTLVASAIILLGVVLLTMGPRARLAPAEAVIHPRSSLLRSRAKRPATLLSPGETGNEHS
jgi:drug/metabolite transporter (DMT)-like permease